MANKHTKRESASLVVRKMQIETIVRYHFIPTGVVVIEKGTVLSMVRMWRNWSHYALLIGMKNGIATVENSLADP